MIQVAFQRVSKNTVVCYAEGHSELSSYLLALAEGAPELGIAPMRRHPLGLFRGAVSFWAAPHLRRCLPAVGTIYGHHPRLCNSVAFQAKVYHLGGPMKDERKAYA